MEREMNLLEIIQAFIKRFRLVMVIVIIFGVLVGGASLFINDREYQSSAKLIVGEETQKETDRINPINGEPIYETVIQFGNSSISEPSKSFYMETLQRRDLLTEVIDNLDLQLTPSELSQNIKMEVPENSSSITISVGILDYKEVDQIVNEITDVFIDKVNEITEVEKIKVLDSASEPTLVNNVNYTRNIAIAIIAGLGISFVVVLVLEYFDDSVESESDIEKILKAPVIGKLENENTLTENIKLIRTNLENSPNLQDKKIITVTTIDKNINIAVELAESLRKAENKVLLIDANFREPELDKILGLSNDYGLSNILSEEIDMQQILQLAEQNQVISTGNSLENPSEKLAGTKMEKLLEELKTHFDYIIINGFEINKFTDTLEMSTLTDGVILLVEQNNTSLKELKEVKEKLSNIKVDILGVAFKKYN